MSGAPYSLRFEQSIDQIAEQAGEWRRQLHQQPELGFDLQRTAEFVITRLRELPSLEIHSEIAKSGVVAVIQGELGAGKVIGLRCDMDALPVFEETGKSYASHNSGRMHACGHDGHTAIMLGAAKVLSGHRNFAGKVVLIFQPAEESGGGARIMLQEGLLEKFGIEEVYALHNLPGLPVGHFAIRSGPIFASSDRFIIEIRGKGGHAGIPHLACDPVVAAANLICALQQIVSRKVDPLDAVALSATFFHAGKMEALNVIPETVTVGGTIRTLRAETRESVFRAAKKITAAICAAGDVEGTFEIFEGYPTTLNDPRAVSLSTQAAVAASDPAKVDVDCNPTMGAEDFSFMLQQRPGAMIWLGNGDSASLHSPYYDFNDQAIRHGIAYWLALIQNILGPTSASQPAEPGISYPANTRRAPSV